MSPSASSSSKTGSPSAPLGLIKGQGCLPWTQRHADIVTYGILLHAYENRHKIYAMEGLFGEVDNHGCDRLGKQVITCLKDMAIARGLDPTIVDDIRKGRGTGGGREKSEGSSGSVASKRRSELGFAVVSGTRGTKRKIASSPMTVPKGKVKKHDDEDEMNEGDKRKGKMRDVHVIELLDSDDEAIDTEMNEELD